MNLSMYSSFSDTVKNEGIAVAAKNARSLGFWLWVPEDNIQCWVQGFYRYDTNGDGTYDTLAEVNMMASENVYYNVDEIHRGIAENRKIRFHYFEYNVQKERRFRRDGAWYVISPYALSWDDENYYLITYKEKYDSYTHYRVDKMEGIELTEHDRVLSDKPFDLSAYSKSMFQMFSGEETDVSIEFENKLVGVVFDRFGSDIPIIKSDEEHFICHVKVAVSPHFLSWIMSFGKRAKILSPDYVVEEMYQLARDITDIYEK